MRALRGATCLTANDADEMRVAVGELLREMLERNGLVIDDLISVILTSTPDLTCAFPAAYAREIGMIDVPLLCAQEIDVEGALPRVIRAMIHADTDVPRADIKHVYLRGAEALRRDIAQ